MSGHTLNICWVNKWTIIEEIKTINPTGNQLWLFTGQTDAEAEAEAPILWPPDAKSQLIGKDSDAGKGWGQEEKKVTEDEMGGWHHWLNEHESEQNPREAWCATIHGMAELDTTRQQNHNSSKHHMCLLPCTYSRIYHLPLGQPSDCICCSSFNAYILMTHINIKKSYLPIFILIAG